MPSISNTFESQASGTTVTTANSDGPSSRAFDVVLIGSGATCTYDSTHAHAAGQGTRGLKLQTAAGAGITAVAWGPGGIAPAVNRIYGRCYLYFETTPTANWRFFQARGAGANYAAFNVSSTGKIQIVRATGGIVSTGTATMAINTLYRLEWDITFDALFGSCVLNLYAGDATSTTDSLSVVAAENFGGTTADEYRFGINVSQASIGPYWLDDININDLAIFATNIFRPSMAPRAPRRARTGLGELVQL